jgi:hypothetical protein
VRNQHVAVVGESVVGMLDTQRLETGGKMEHRFCNLMGRITLSALVALMARPMTASCALVSDGSIGRERPVATEGLLLMAQEGSLRERLRNSKIDQVAAELEKNPKLLDDPKYLEQHPKLANYLTQHPEAKEKIKKDPKAFFQQMKQSE